MSELSLSLFGPFQAYLDGQPISSFQTRKVQALLIYLTAVPQKHTREHLMDLMWPGMPTRSARHNLRQVLYYLRSAIPDLNAKQKEEGEKVHFLLTNRQTIQLNPETAVSVDVIQFEALLAEVQAHEHFNVISCPSCLAQLEKATELYRGDFLADFYLDDSNEFEDWAQITRESYRRKVLDALELLTTAATQKREFPQARALARKQLEIDNLRESAYRQLMKILALSGYREEAYTIYENCRQLLLEELSMSPSKRTTELAEKIQAGELNFDTSSLQNVRGYELKDSIGEGAHGAIHRANQTAVDREVVIKLIRPKYANDPEFIRRFELEAQTVARLEHPHIVPLYDYWRDPEGAYLVMRYLKGGNLLSALEAGPWELDTTAQMLDQISTALSAAHQQGVIHRDIKPANILLDHDGNAYLSDFGIAKVANSELEATAHGAIVGTLDYISPEQLQSEPITPQTDIYSLGAVLYETLTGEKPFPDATPANLIYKHLHMPIPYVAESRPHLPHEVDLIIQRATAKDPAERYSNALDLADDFKKILSGKASPVSIDQAGIQLAEEDIYNPYKGLRAFQESDADDFFGRESLTQQLVARLNNSRFLALVGPSGSGKSSAVKAGLIPVLREGAISGSQNWFVAEMVPGTHPLEELEMALWPIAVDPPPSMVDPMERDNRGLLRTIRRILPTSPNQEEESQLLLIIDQFEELFTQVENEERRSFFIDSLLQAIHAPRSPLRVVLTLRADFYDRPLVYETLGRLLKNNTEVILPLTSEELTWAMREPARHVGVVFEEGLAEVMVADIVDQPGALPLLQYALTELFERRENKIMTQQAYREIGGVLGALGRRAEAIYASLTDQEQALAQQQFFRLVTLGEGREDTRRRVVQSELEILQNAERVGGSLSLSPKSHMNDIVDLFGKARLLTFDHDPITREPTVEVAHEALIREWPRLRQWLIDSREDLRRQRELAHAAQQWQQANEDSSYLLLGGRLALFETWEEETAVALTQEEQSFLNKSIQASQARESAEEARRQRELETAQQLAETEKKRAEEQTTAASRLRRRAIYLYIVMGLAVMAAMVAAILGQQAQTNANLAIEAANAEATAAAVAEERLIESEKLRIAAEANSVLLGGRSGELATLLALKSLELGYSAEADQALSQGLSQGYLFNQFVGHTEQVRNLKFSPDGTLLLSTGGNSGELIIWNVNEGTIHNKFQFESSVDSAIFTHDGQHIIAGVGSIGTGLIENRVQIFDIDTREKVGSVPVTAASYNYWSATLSPDGRWLFVGWDSRQGAIFDLQDPENAQLIRLRGHQGDILAADFSNDGNWLVTSSSDHTAVLWDFKHGELIQEFVGHQGMVTAVAFSPDDQTIVTNSWDGSARLWDVTTGEQIAKFETTSNVQYEFTLEAPIDPNSGRAFGAEFSPDGSLLFLSRNDQSLEVWSVEELRLLRSWSGIAGDAIAISPDGQTIAVSNKSRISLVTLNDFLNPTLMDFGESTTAAEFSPNGNTFVSSNGLVVQKWSIEDGRILSNINIQVNRPGGLLNRISQLAFIEDSNGVLVLGDDFTLDWIDFDTGQITQIRITDQNSGGTGGLSTDGQWVLVPAFLDNIGVILEIPSDVSPQIINLDPQTVQFLPEPDNLSEIGIDFDQSYISPNKRFVINNVDDDSRVEIWDVESGAYLGQFVGHDDNVYAMTISSDSQRVVTGGADGTVRLWDIETRQSTTQFEIPTENVTAVAIDPNGEFVIAGSSDGLIRLWDLASGDQLRQWSASNESIENVKISPDSQWLLTIDDEGDLRVWYTDLDQVIALACRLLPRDLTEIERTLHGIQAQDPTCKSD